LEVGGVGGVGRLAELARGVSYRRTAVGGRDQGVGSDRVVAVAVHLPIGHQAAVQVRCLTTSVQAILAGAAGVAATVAVGGVALDVDALAAARLDRGLTRALGE